MKNKIMRKIGFVIILVISICLLCFSGSSQILKISYADEIIPNGVGGETGSFSSSLANSMHKVPEEVKFSVNFEDGTSKVARKTDHTVAKAAKKINIDDLKRNDGDSNSSSGEKPNYYGYITTNSNEQSIEQEDTEDATQTEYGITFGIIAVMIFYGIFYLIQYFLGFGTAYRETKARGDTGVCLFGWFLLYSVIVSYIPGLGIYFWYKSRNKATTT